MPSRLMLLGTVVTQLDAAGQAARKQREQDKQRKQDSKNELDQAYRDLIVMLTTLHRQCGRTWDWLTMRLSDPPAKPVIPRTQETAAQKRLQRYRPAFFDMLLGKEQIVRRKLAEDVIAARQADVKASEDIMKAYEQSCTEWTALRELGGRVISHDGDAYLEVLKLLNPFAKIPVGKAIQFRAEGGAILEADLTVLSEDDFPSELKALSKTDRVLVKSGSTPLFYELYQDHVCSAVLRVAREVFAILPVETLIVTAIANVLNTQTGHTESTPILSVAIPSLAERALDFSRLDPADAMHNFQHRLRLRKARGFERIVPLTAAEVAGKS